MPLIYGEEHKAFERLQREIIRTSTDETVFSWGEDFRDAEGLFAPKPSVYSRDYVS
ncbi:hypothetical protein MMC28_009264 [Mycoblastus sanguinarius]|nr:hypothetical protein [Mycoblastus sanguinarius]